MTHRRTIRRISGVLVVALSMFALGACTDDGYSAPDREVSFADVLDVAGTTDALALDTTHYEEAVGHVVAVTGLDPSEPGSYLDGGRPDPDTVDFVVVCAWAAAAAAGDDVPGELAGDLVDRTSESGCDGLSTEALSVAVGQLAPGGDEADRPLLLDRVTLERAMYEAFAPEIAEAVAN